MKLTPNVSPSLDFDLCSDVTTCAIKPTNNNKHRLAI